MTKQRSLTPVAGRITPRYCGIHVGIVALATVTGMMGTSRECNGQDEEMVGKPAIGQFPYVDLGLDVAMADTHGDAPVSSSLLPKVRLHQPIGPVLLSLEGRYNVSGGDVAWMSRAEIVLGMPLTHRMVNSLSDLGTVPAVGSANRRLQTYVGLATGISLWKMHSASSEAALGDGTATPGGVAPVLDIGLTARSPQFEFTLSYLHEFETVAKGVRMVMAYGIPVADRIAFIEFHSEIFSEEGSADWEPRFCGSVILGLGVTSGLRFVERRDTVQQLM